MGKKGTWFSSVKKALSPDSKEKKEQRSDKSKKKWFGKQKQPQFESIYLAPPPPTLQPPPPQEEVKSTNVVNEPQIYAEPVVEVVATATIEPEVPAPPPAQTPREVVRLPKVTQYSGKSREEVAAIKIQTAFRGYLARRALRALRGLVRLKTLIEGSVVKRQATNTLKCMQTLSRVQAQIRSRRIRMLEENQALQRQLLLKHAKETLQLGDEWDDSLQSKEQVEANLLSKHEATMRRERALAYAFSHQKNGKNAAKSVNPMFMDPSNPTWGWSWLERWMAARPWESHGTPDKEIPEDRSSVKSVISRGISPGEINNSYARYLLNSDKQSPTASEKPGHPGFRSPSTPSSKPGSAKVAKKLKPSLSPRGGVRTPDEDTKSMASVQSAQFRRHSIAGSSVRDDESLDSSPSLPSYMVPTKSARAKSRMQSPSEKNGITDKDSQSVKKQLSFPASPARPRRHSGPPKVDTSLSLRKAKRAVLKLEVDCNKQRIHEDWMKEK